MNIKEKLDTSFGKILLIIVVIGIWSYNFISFSELGSGQEKIRKSGVRHVNINQVKLPATLNYRYPDIQRDPFKASGTVKTVRLQEQRSPATEEFVNLPPIRLTGIIEHTAIILFDNTESLIVAKGDTFRNITVEQVFEDSVTVRFMNKKFTLTF